MVKQERINDILIRAHRKGVEQAIELSIRTGVPLVEQIDGKIVYIKPKFKYVLVPIDEPEVKE